MILAIALISFIAYRSSDDPIMLFCASYALVLAACIACKRADSLGIFRRHFKAGHSLTSSQDKTV